MAQIRKDFLLHWFYGTILAIISIPFLGYVSVLVIALIAVMKEAYDYRNRDVSKVYNTYNSAMDIVATYLPSCLIYLALEYAK